MGTEPAAISDQEFKGGVLELMKELRGTAREALESGTRRNNASTYLMYATVGTLILSLFASIFSEPKSHTTDK